MERIRDAIQKARRARGGDSDFGIEATHASYNDRKPRMDIEGAWLSMPEISVDARNFRRNRIITMACEDPSYTHFDIMRTKILTEMKRNAWRSLAITSPNPHCGKTMIAANLAFSFARQKELKTIVIDVDLRRPQLAKTLGLRPGPSMATFLSGTEESKSQFVRFEANLAIGASFTSTKRSAELLSSSQTRKSIDALYATLEPDVVIYDMPPLMASDDALAFLPSVDCTLLVVEAERSTVREVDESESSLAEYSNLLGVVLNKCRFETEIYNYYGEY